jgi:hypothetical protein
LKGVDMKAPPERVVYLGLSIYCNMAGLRR